MILTLLTLCYITRLTPKGHGTFTIYSRTVSHNRALNSLFPPEMPHIGCTRKLYNIEYVDIFFNCGYLI